MIIEDLNFRGDFKAKTSTGKRNTYRKGDVVYFKKETYVAYRTVVGQSPLTGEKAGWYCLAKTQIFFESPTAPKIAKQGDEWFDTSTGKKYKRISDLNGEHWIEI